MLTKEEYKKIASHWKGTVYQLYDRYQVRFPTLLKHIDVFKGKNVLEVGCNAGLAAYHIAQVANSYIGVEGEKDYWLQSLETKKLIETNNAEFLNMSIKSYMKRAIRDGIEISANACYLSYVLYHFSDKEVQMFEQFILPKLDVIVVQSRYENRNKKGRTAHNSYKFWKPENVEKYLKKNGFSTTVEFGPRNKFHFIVGIKNTAILRESTESPNPFIGNIEESAPIKMGDWESTDGVQWTEGEMESGKKMLENQIKGYIEKPLVPKEITEDAYNALDELIKEETTDGDTGDSTVHTEGQSKTTRRRGTRSRKRRMAERITCDNAGREADSQGPGGNVRAEDGEDGVKDILFPGVEKGTTEEVRDKDIQEVVKTPRRRRRTKAVENSDSEDKPAV